MSDAISTARTAIEACDGEGEPKRPTYAERVALAQAYATLAVAKETSKVVDLLGALERRLDGVETAVGRANR